MTHLRARALREAVVTGQHIDDLDGNGDEDFWLVVLVVGLGGCGTRPRSLTGPDQSGRTLAAWGPFWPWVTSKSTFCPSLSSR